MSTHYRWLTRIHPPGPRREELLGTLLDCAPPGRRWPTVRETITMIRYGLRARLGRPASRGVVALAVLAAFFGGLTGAAAASWLGWQAAPALPTGAEAAGISSTVFPGLPVWGGGDAPAFVPSADGEGTQYGYASSWVEHTAQTRDVRAYAEGARDRLRDAGWNIVTEVGVVDDAVTFVAVRGGLVLEFENDVRTGQPWYDSAGQAGYELARSATWWQWAGTLTGALLGGLAGWLLTGWASRRSEHRPAFARGSAALAGIGFALSVPMVLMGLAAMTVATEPGRPADEAFFLALRWVPYLMVLPFFWLIPGGFLLAAAAGGMHLPRRRAAPVATVTVVLVVAVLAGWSPLIERLTAGPDTGSAAPCVLRPGAAPAEPPADLVRTSTVALVFVGQTATPEQRNLIEAAIRRISATRGHLFAYDPQSGLYRDAYCGGALLPPGVGATLPYFFEVDLQSPGVFGGLAAEVAGMPGVVAVQRGLPRE